MKWYSPNMAASMLHRLLLSGRTSVNFRSLRSNGRRGLLSAAYTDPSVWEQREPDSQSLAALAMLMDKSQEKKIAVSSLTISRFVDNLSCREEVDQAEYYLYKFRHSPNCWYLRDWTIHSWIRQCLKHGARDKALYTLKNKVQFGIFPDEFSFNLLMDSYLKDEDYKGAIAVVEEVMLQEAFDLPSTQMLSLFALSKYLGGRPEISWQEERNVGAALLLAGLKQENTAGLSAQLLGLALIGKVEMIRGIHSVFHNMPLTWSRGYLGRSLQVIERVCDHAGELKLSTNVVDDVQRILEELSSSSVKAAEQNLTEQQAGSIDEDDEQEGAKLPQYMSKFQELKERLQTQGKLEAQTLDSLASLLIEEKLAVCEERDMAQYRDRLHLWETERLQLVQREKEMRQKVKQES